jgi:acyl-CoA synthetase (AMP-forming)/AMP-acid ligase II
LIELGVLRSKSRSADSLWVKLGGEGYKTRVKNGILQIKAKSSMLGYLNAPSPFTEDGWFDTQDAVEVEGEYFRILGRKSDIINVGGQKVYPAEVESLILELDNISEVTVYGEKNVIIGHIVCAKVKLIEAEDKQQLAARIKKYCREKLENYKVPVKIIAVETELHTSRFKKARREDLGGSAP